MYVSIPCKMCDYMDVPQRIYTRILVYTHNKLDKTRKNFSYVAKIVRNDGLAIVLVMTGSDRVGRSTTEG